MTSLSLDKTIKFYSTPEKLLGLLASRLTYEKEANDINYYYLTFKVNLETYQKIATESLFNLKPEAKTTTKEINFQPTPDIEITATLHPNLLPQLQEFKESNQPVTYLLNLNQTQPDHPLFYTENWFATEIKQGEIGYCTFWSYVSPHVLLQEDISGEQISQTMQKYFQQWAEDNLATLATEATEDTFTEITKSLEELADSQFQAIAEETTSELLGAIAETFQGLATETNNGHKVPATLWQAVVEFLEKDGWPWQQVEGESSLYTAFEGDNGKCQCYAKVREEQQQFVFYSLCPIKVPKKKRRQLGEFICRANYGAIIGNFELDFDDGEIRYKTSIDVEGDSLSFSLIKQMVYANVTMMDKYLPGIKAMIEGQASPQEAVIQIET